MQVIESTEYNLHMHDMHQENGSEIYLTIPPVTVRRGMTLI